MFDKQEITKEEKNKLIRGIIYKIYSPDNPDMVYIGSTASSLKDRMLGHRRSYRRWTKLKTGYIASFKIFDKYKDNVVIEKVDKLYFEEDEKYKLLQLEGKYQRKINCINLVTNNDTSWGRSVWKCKKNEEIGNMEENPFKNFRYNN
jgi:hypothetical protein